MRIPKFDEWSKTTETTAIIGRPRNDSSDAFDDCVCGRNDTIGY